MNGSLLNICFKNTENIQEHMFKIHIFIVDDIEYKYSLFSYHLKSNKSIFITYNTKKQLILGK